MQSGAEVGLLVAFAGGAAVVAGALVALVALRRGRRRFAVRIVISLVVWCALYVGVVLVSAWRSEETVLAQGRTEHLCGLYLDCRVGVAVAGVERTKTVAGGGATFGYTRGTGRRHGQTVRRRA
jgi:hypothetical protein